MYDSLFDLCFLSSFVSLALLVARNLAKKKPARKLMLACPSGKSYLLLRFFLFLENNDVIIFDLIFINFLLVWRRRTPIFSLCVKEGYLFPITEIGVSTCRLYYFFCKTQPASWFFYDAHFEAYSKSFFRLLTRISRGLSKRPSGP